jgi:hypothetical protein
MNIYTNTLEEIAENESARMVVTKMKFEFSQNPLLAIQKTNKMIWGDAGDQACVSLLVAMAAVNAPRWREAVRACMEAALWHPCTEIAEQAALGLLHVNDAKSISAIEEVSRLYPENKVFPHVCARLLRPL